MKARFLLSRKKALEQYAAARSLCDEVSYSVKTNPALVEILEGTDSMFSVHSMSYLHLIKDKKRVLFLAQSWSEKEIDHLVNQGVASFVVDNENDLKVILDYITKKGCRINLFLRMRLKERTVHTERHFVFGMYSRQINRLIPELRKNERITKLGIHFHRKTQNVTEWELKQELQDILEKKTLECIDIMNIGGGLPVKYRNHTADTLPYIFEKIREFREWLDQNDIRMSIEPGRFICGPAVKLEAEILNIYGNNIILNCSVYNSAMDTFVAHIRLLVEGEKEYGKAYTIKGCLPDSMDVFRYRVYLDGPKAGDKIVFLNAGAYTYHADLCSLEKLETIIID